MMNPYRKLRESFSETQVEFGERIDVSERRVRQLESGEGHLSASKLLALQKKHGRSIKRLGLSIEDFLGGSR